MRLFVAIDVPDEIRNAIESEIVDRMRDRVPGARWTRPEGRHLTLKFLGSVDRDRVPAIGEALRETALRHASFEASFAEVGGFPNLKRPRVLWIGVGEGAEPMSALARDLEAAVEPLGFDPEGRTFQGHLTLARFKEPKVIDVPGVTVQLNRFSVNEILLFESRLHPKGARYSVVEEFALSG